MSADDRFIVFRCRPIGLGHIIITLVQILYLSDELGRVPAFDLRESHYFPEDAHRAFFDCFAIRAPDGKQVITDLQTIDSLYADPEVEDRGSFTPWGFVRDSPARVVVIDGTHVSSFLPVEAKPVPPRFRLDLTAGFAARVREALPPKPDDERWIGLHFRHGNGEFLAWRFDPFVTPDYAVRYEEIKRKYVDLALLAAKARFSGRARFYIASDSSEFIAWCRAHLPDTIVRSDRSVDGHWEVLARTGDGRQALLEATQDLWNLSRCDFLIHGDSLLPQAAFYNSETLGSNDAFQVTLPDLRTLVLESPPEQAVAIARSVFRRFIERAGHIAPATGEKLAGWLSERHLDHEAAWLARHVAWFGAFDADRTVADARACLSNGLPAAALCTGEGVDPALGDNPHYLVFRAAVLEAAGDARNAVVALEAAERVDPATPGLQEARRRLLLAMGRGRSAVATGVNAIQAYGWDEENKAQIMVLLRHLSGSGQRG
ncbi:MAG TPA: hypothetical protein VIZ17_20880 [Acetobacteraceae bacterium]